MALPIKKIRINEVKDVIQYKTNLIKAPGYDLITRNILKKSTQKILRALAQM
jgi:hypothetical protein